MPVKTAIIFCGMPGSGKSIGATVAKDLGIPVFVMGDVVREEVSKRQLPHTPQSLGQVMINLREQFGPAIIAQRIIKKLQSTSYPHVVIDGARSEAEIEEFRKAISQICIVAVHASPQIRFQRLSQRGREDDTLTHEAFHERDARELDVGIGRLIAQADIMIINEGEYEELKSKIHQVLIQTFNLD
ncbi:MAG: AAA family ATPase [Promethearchaeota archaeon]